MKIRMKKTGGRIIEEDDVYTLVLKLKDGSEINLTECTFETWGSSNKSSLPIRYVSEQISKKLSENSQLELHKRKGENFRICASITKNTIVIS